MYIKFNIIHRLQATLVVAGLLLFPSFSASAGKNGIYTTIRTEGMNNLSSSQAVPPPLGPPAPWGNPPPEVPVWFLTNKLETQLDKVEQDLNDHMAQNPDLQFKVTISIERVFGPFMRQTEHSNRPNEYFAHLSYTLNYHIYDIKILKSIDWILLPKWLRDHTPYSPTVYFWSSPPVERHISQTIDFPIFCNKWQTGEGNLLLRPYLHTPSLKDEQGTFEKVLDLFLLGYLTNYIDSLVRSNLSDIQSGPGMDVDLFFHCDTLGSETGNPDSPQDDAITYSYHPRSTPQVPTAYDQVSVSLTKVRRLVARDQGQTVLYDLMEAPNLTMYVNHRFTSIQLPTLSEGQEASLNGPTLMIGRPADTELLVVIANLILGSSNSPVEESAFRVFNSSANFGQGTQTLIIQKSYWTEFDPKTGNKPYEVFVDAYELTFQVSTLEGADH